MKNVVKIIMFMFLCVLNLTGTVSASKGMSISNWNVECDILDDGAIKINEYITFEFYKNFNGVFRNIKLNGTDGIKDLKIYEVTKNKYIEFKQADEKNNEGNGSYKILSSENSNDIRIYSPSKKNEKKTFNIIYTVKNVCKKYTDIGELYYSFISNDNDTYIEKFNANINLPYDFCKDKVKIFAHGPLNGVIKFVDNNTINLNVEYVKNNLVTARIIFPKEYIKMSTNKINKRGYDEIMHEENRCIQNIKESIIKKEKEEKNRHYTNIGLGILGIVIFSIFTIRNIKSNDKYINQNFSNGFLPDQCSPAVLNEFLKGTVNDKSIVTTILDLNRKKCFKIEELKKLDNLDNNDRIKNYGITLENKDEHLLKHEKYFIDWIINDIGDGKTVTTDKISKYTEKNMSKFNDEFDKWKKLIEEETLERGYYDLNIRKKSVDLLIVFSILLVISILCGIIPTLLYIALLIATYICFYNKKSAYGKMEYIKWQKLKRNIEHGQVEQMSKLYPLEKYFLYFTVLDIEEKNLYDLKKFIDLGYDYHSNPGFIWIYFNDEYFIKSIGSSFASTSVGSGGGFTSGGGGSGGGGAGGF